MTAFDLATLELDLSVITPPAADIRVLGLPFKETVEHAVRGRDYELLRSFCRGIGETRLRGVARSLNLEERSSVVDKLLSGVLKKSSPEME